MHSRIELELGAVEGADYRHRALGLLERYAAGDVSIDHLANEHGMNDRTLNDILKNPIYNGWVLVGRRLEAQIVERILLEEAPRPGRPKIEPSWRDFRLYGDRPCTRVASETRDR